MLQWEMRVIAVRSQQGHLAGRIMRRIGPVEFDQNMTASKTVEVIWMIDYGQRCPSHCQQAPFVFARSKTVNP
jgi:hypothetical protein